MNENQHITNNFLLNEIAWLIDNSRKKVAVTVNQELTLLYWNIGKIINEDILKKDRADYRKRVIPELSEALTLKYGKGFNKRNLQIFIKLHSVFQDITILCTLCSKLTWSHIRDLIYIENHIKREFYIQY